MFFLFSSYSPLPPLPSPFRSFRHVDSSCQRGRIKRVGNKVVGGSFGRFAGKTSCREGRALAVTRACDNTSPLVNQLSVNT